MEIQLRKKPPRQSGPKKRPRGLPFQKGEIHRDSPGRPRKLRTCELPKGTREAFTVLSDKAFEALDRILEDDFHPRHEQAVEYVLNQKYGTARQSIDLNDPNGSFAGKHELTVSFANMPNSVAVTRVGVDSSQKPWDAKPEEPKAELKPEEVPAVDAVVAVVSNVSEAIARTLATSKAFRLPWEVDEDDDE